jgi:hypothetical protein
MTDRQLASRAVEEAARQGLIHLTDAIVLLIVQEAEHAGIAVSLGFALVEQETGFQNIYGHDGTASVPATLAKGQLSSEYPVRGGHVTKANYAIYKKRRGTRGQGGMQGVGLTQLTYYTLQDEADAIGGCWTAKAQLRIGFAELASLIKAHGQHAGIKAYNGTGRAAERYAVMVQVKAERWHGALA